MFGHCSSGAVRTRVRSSASPPAPDGTVDAFVDGTAVAVLDDAEELTTTKPGFVFALDGLRFIETFGASPTSLTDLRDALQTGQPPRRKHVRELIEDGLVRPHPRPDDAWSPRARARRSTRSPRRGGNDADDQHSWARSRACPASTSREHSPTSRALPRGRLCGSPPR